MYAVTIVIYLPEHCICSPTARHRKRRGFFIQVFISYVLILIFNIYNENPNMQPNNIYINSNKQVYARLRLATAFGGFLHLLTFQMPFNLSLPII